MRLRCHLSEILFLICHTLTLAKFDHHVQERSNYGDTSYKRNLNEYPSCLESYDIHNDKIIRTQDSKAQGAQYLNERDVSTREDCMQLCCSTDNCDVFIFEETKVPGGCYLFECGPPEEFKCKFTTYKNYTSGFLNFNRHLNDLENQIKFSQHEKELTKLKEPYFKPSPKPETLLQRTSQPPRTKEVIEAYIQEADPNPIVKTKKGCSRNQFECHSTGECIAIYNACDGIPQCSDGSDESPELGCPATPSTIAAPVKHVKPTFAPIVQQPQELVPESVGNGASPGNEREMTPVRKLWPSREEYGVKKELPYSGSYQQKHLPSIGGQMDGMNVPDNPRSGYGREGEEMANYKGPEQPPGWSSMQFRHNQGTQIFTHKGESLVPQNNHYQPQQHYIPPESQIRPAVPYNDPAQGEYAKYYMETPPFNRGYGQGSVPNNWQAGSKPHNLNNPEQVQPVDEMPMRSDLPQNNPYPDYYYEDMYKNKMQVPQQQQFAAIPPAAPYLQYNEMSPQQPKVKVMNPVAVDQKPVPEVPVQKSTAEPVAATTVKPKVQTSKSNENGAKTQDSHVQTSHRKIDKLDAEVKIKESSLNLEDELHANSPRGAILSLTMGLCITGIMLILVGCRMRVVSKRMRRAGKGLSHDADFLVNGMYL